MISFTALITIFTSLRQKIRAKDTSHSTDFLFPDPLPAVRNTFYFSFHWNPYEGLFVYAVMGPVARGVIRFTDFIFKRRRNHA